MWTIKPDSNCTKSYVPLSDPDAQATDSLHMHPLPADPLCHLQAAIAATGPIAFEIPAAKTEERQLNVYAAIKDNNSDKLLGLLVLKANFGQTFSGSQLLLLKMVLRQMEQLLRDTKDLTNARKELRAHEVEAQFFQSSAVDSQNSQIGASDLCVCRPSVLSLFLSLLQAKLQDSQSALSSSASRDLFLWTAPSVVLISARCCAGAALVGHVQKLVDDSTCQMLSYDDVHEIFADVVSGKNFTVGGQAKLAMHSRKSHLVSEATLVSHCCICFRLSRSCSFGAACCH